MNVFDLLHENAVADKNLLRKKDEMGDVFANARDVDFAFKTSDRERANDLCEYIKGKNFGNPHIRGNDGDLLWIIVIIRMPINQPLLCCVSGFMVCLSRLFQVEYDGWGSVNQPEGT